MSTSLLLKDSTSSEPREHLTAEGLLYQSFIWGLIWNYWQQQCELHMKVPAWTSCTQKHQNPQKAASKALDRSSKRAAQCCILAAELNMFPSHAAVTGALRCKLRRSKLSSWVKVYQWFIYDITKKVTPLNGNGKELCEDSGSLLTLGLNVFKQRMIFNHRLCLYWVILGYWLSTCDSKAETFVFFFFHISRTHFYHAVNIYSQINNESLGTWSRRWKVGLVRHQL